MFEILTEQWRSLTGSAKVGLAVGILVILGVLVGGALWILRDNYQVLFADLNERDAAAMVAELDRLKTPYRLSDGGTTVLVEEDAVYRTRLKLMSKGISLNGTVGFEIFNNADFGMTEFSQKVNYQRALQGELARTIMAFEEIKAARVHLVLPETGLLKRQNQKAKASISLALKHDRALDAEQITGIQRLVAASVPDIDPAAVTIVDQRGKAISAVSGENSGDAAIPARLNTKLAVEDYFTRKIAAVLDKAIGPGKAIVSVDVTIDYDQVRITKEDVVPLPGTLGQPVGAVSRKRETRQGVDAFAELMNVGATQNGSAPGSRAPGAYSAETEFANGRRVEQVVTTPGGIKRVSVGVLLPAGVDAIEVAKLKEMVSMAAGVNIERGDAIAVYGIGAADLLSPVTADHTSSAGNSLDSVSVVDLHEAVEVPVVDPNRLLIPRWSVVVSVTTLLFTLLVALVLMRFRSVRSRQRDREILLSDIAKWEAAKGI